MVANRNHRQAGSQSSDGRAQNHCNGPSRRAAAISIRAETGLQRPSRSSHERRADRNLSRPINIAGNTLPYNSACLLLPPQSGERRELFTTYLPRPRNDPLVGRPMTYWKPQLSLYTVLAWCVGIAAASGQQLNPQQIELIRDTAASICNTVKEAKGQQSDVQIQGDVSAKLGGLVGKVVDVGGSGRGSLTREQFEGLSREATATAMEGDRGCRERVFDKMFDKLSAEEPGKRDRAETNPSGRAPTPSPELASPRPHSELSGVKSTNQPIYVFSSNSRPEDEELVEDLSAALKSKGLQVASSRNGAALLVRVADTSVTDRTRVSRNGNIVHYATARANITAIRTQSTVAIFPEPTVEGIAQGENIYDVRESARAAMIEAAVLRFQTLTAR